MPDRMPLQLVKSERKEFRRSGLGYIFEPAGANVRLRVDRLKARTDETTAELVAEALNGDAVGHLHRARFTLSSTTARATLAKHLIGLSGPGVPWLQYLEQLCVAVLNAEDAGDPFVMIGRLPARTRSPDLVEGFLPAGKATLLYASGGTGKSRLAAAVSVCVTVGMPLAGIAVRQCPVLVLDWEDDAETWDETVKAVSRGLGLEEPPELHYRPMRSPLPNQVERIARYVQDNRIGLVISDSVEMASGSVGDRATYEDAAKRYFGAIRMIPATWLNLDHISAAAAENDKGPNKPINSIMKLAWVRNAWEMRADQQPGQPFTRLALHHTKVNNGPLLRPIGLGFDWSQPESLIITKEDIADSPKLSKRLPLHEKLAIALRHGALSVFDLSGACEATEGAVRAELSRRDKFTKLHDGRWANKTFEVVPRNPGDLPLRETPEDLPF